MTKGQCMYNQLFTAALEGLRPSGQAVFSDSMNHASIINGIRATASLKH